MSNSSEYTCNTASLLSNTENQVLKKSDAFLLQRAWVVTSKISISEYLKSIQYIFISKLRLTIKPKKEYRVTRDISGNVIDSMLTYNGNGLQGGLNSTPTSWWDTAFINKTNPYAKIKENLYWYLYHDTKNKKVYFLTFDT